MSQAETFECKNIFLALQKRIIVKQNERREKLRRKISQMKNWDTKRYERPSLQRTSAIQKDSSSAGIENDVEMGINL